MSERAPRRYLVRRNGTGRWLSYFLSPEQGSTGAGTRLVYRVMGDHDSMCSAIEGIYE